MSKNKAVAYVTEGEDDKPCRTCNKPTKYNLSIEALKIPFCPRCLTCVGALMAEVGSRLESRDAEPKPKLGIVR